MPGVPLGKLTDRIRIVRPSETQADDGTVVRAEADVATVWGRVEFVTGQESLGRGLLRATAGYVVELPFRADLFEAGPKWGLVITSRPWNGKRFGIASIAPNVPRRSMMTAVCQTGSDAAV